MACFKRGAAAALLMMWGAGVFSLEPEMQEAVADKYAQWAEKTIARGELETALAFLERARDYASVSSDLSYLLASTREALGFPAPAVLEPALLALETGIWTRAGETAARLLCARACLKLGRASQALAVLDAAPPSSSRAFLRLRALEDAPASVLSAELGAALDRYPGDVSIARFAFRLLRRRGNEAAFGSQAALLFKRLPALREADGSIAFDAAAFAANEEDARLILSSAYAESNGAPPQSALPDLLRYGVLDEAAAEHILFSAPAPSAAAVRAQYGLLRTDAARDSFRARLLSFTGTITDGGGNARADYENGLLVRFTFDANGDGDAGLILYAEGGIPQSAVTGSTARRSGILGSAFDSSAPGSIELRYAEYPAVSQARFTPRSGREIIFRFRPFEFFYRPVTFESLAGPYGLPFPLPAAAPLSVRTLWAYAGEAETDGGTFEKSRLILSLKDGLIIEGNEYVEGRPAARDIFSGGVLYERRADMDLDGTPETRLLVPGGARFDNPADYLRQFHGAQADASGGAAFAP